MSYHIYQTEGLVLRGLAYREADRSLRILTPDLGMIDATAAGIRHEKSKLRYSLQEFSLASLSLVRGKAGWRVVSAAVNHDFFSELRGSGGVNNTRARLAVATRTLSLVMRLVQGEEASPEFYSLVLDGLHFLAALPAASPDTLANAECLIVLRLLRYLGYVGDSSEKLEGILQGSVWTDSELKTLAPLRRDVVAIINAALRETQL